MANEITENQMDKMRYRRFVVKDKLRNIEQIVTGRAESYLPFISDEDGRVTKEKTERFIAEMLNALRRYIKLDSRRTLSEDIIKMYESFLYCAVTGLTLERLPRDRDVTKFGLPSAFGDIVSLAGKVDIFGCESYNYYLESCYRGYLAECKRRDETEKNSEFPVHYVICPYNTQMDSDFFGGIKLALQELGYPHFIECLPEDTINKLKGGADKSAEKMEMAKAPVLEKNPPVNYAVDEDVSDAYEGIADERYFDEDYTDILEDYRYSEENQEYLRTAEEDNNILEEIESLPENKTYADSRFLKNQPHEKIHQLEQRKALNENPDVISQWTNKVLFDEETLFKNFYRFMWLYFDNPDRRYFVEDIENMVDTFLFENGISAFSLGDDFAMVNYFIDHMKMRIEGEIRRGKRK